MGIEIGVVWLWMSLGLQDSTGRPVLVREGPYNSFKQCDIVGTEWMKKIRGKWPNATAWCVSIEGSNHDNSDPDAAMHRRGRDNCRNCVDL